MSTPNRLKTNTKLSQKDNDLTIKEEDENEQGNLKANDQKVTKARIYPERYLSSDDEEIKQINSSSEDEDLRKGNSKQNANISSKKFKNELKTIKVCRISFLNFRFQFS